jgi:hypothetical protein
MKNVFINVMWDVFGFSVVAFIIILAVYPLVVLISLIIMGILAFTFLNARLIARKMNSLEDFFGENGLYLLIKAIAIFVLLTAAVGTLVPNEESSLLRFVHFELNHPTLMLASLFVVFATSTLGWISVKKFSAAPVPHGLVRGE